MRGDDRSVAWPPRVRPRLPIAAGGTFRSGHRAFFDPSASSTLQGGNTALGHLHLVLLARIATRAVYGARNLRKTARSRCGNAFQVCPSLGVVASAGVRNAKAAHRHAGAHVSILTTQNGVSGHRCCTALSDWGRCFTTWSTNARAHDAVPKVAAFTLVVSA